MPVQVPLIQVESRMLTPSSRRVWPTVSSPELPLSADASLLSVNKKSTLEIDMNKTSTLLHVVTGLSTVASSPMVLEDISSCDSGHSGSLIRDILINSSSSRLNQKSRSRKRVRK